MDEYLQEYEHRQREKAYFKKNNDRGLPASSIHQESLHGNSYHGRRIITSNMIESLDTIGNEGMENNNTSDIANDVAADIGHASQDRAV